MATKKLDTTEMVLYPDDAPSTLAQRLRRLRKDRGLTLTMLAERTGVCYQTIQAIENGKTKNPGCIIRLADALGVSPRWLKTGDGPVGGDPPPASITATAAMTDSFILVPRYNVLASAGFGGVVESEQVVDHLAFKRAWVQGEMGLDPDRLALISALGDSMSPTINNGDLLLVDLRPFQVRDGVLAVLRMGGDLYVKRPQKLLGGGFRLNSDNPSYRPQDLAEKDLRGLDLLGRVVWIGRRMV